MGDQPRRAFRSFRHKQTLDTAVPELESEVLEPVALDEADLQPLPLPQAGAGWQRPVLMLLVAAGLAVFAIVAYLKPGAHPGNRAFVDDSETRTVATVVTESVAALYTYDPKQMDAYPDAVRPLLTDRMRCVFDQTVDSTKQFVTSTDTTSEIQVDAVGVSVLEEDRAEAVVSLTSSWSEKGTAMGSESRQLVVAVRKVGDDWLVSDITDLREPPHSADCPRSN